MKLKLKCFKNDLKKIEPIIFMQEYEKEPEVDQIELSFIDSDSAPITYTVVRLTEDKHYIFVGEF